MSSHPDGTTSRLRVLVVDDHPKFAEMLSHAIAAEPEFDCVGHVQSAAEAYRVVEEQHPDVVTMDLHMPNVDGIAATAYLTGRHPDLLVLVLTAHRVNGRMNEVRDSGAVGLILKDASLATVFRAIRSGRRGAFELFADTA
jgi:DNA-binding NarL/FixJ family response regulator